MRLSSRVVLVLLVALLCLPALPVTAQDDLTGEFTTSGGLSIRFPDGFTAVENNTLALGVDNATGTFSMTVAYGDQAMGMEDMAEDATAEDVMAGYLLFLEDNGVPPYDQTQQYTRELPNGYAVVQPFLMLGDAAVEVALDLNEGGYVIAEVFSGGDLTKEEEELALVILATVSVDVNSVTISEGAEGDTDSEDDSDVIPEGARTLDEMPDGKVLFAYGGELSVPVDWKVSEIDWVLNSVSLETSDLLGSIMEIEMYTYDSAEEAAAFHQQLILIMATLGGDPNLDADDPGSFEPDVETVTLPDGRIVTYYENDLISLALIELGDNFWGSVVTINLFASDEEQTAQVKASTRFVAESFILNPAAATVELN